MDKRVGVTYLPAITGVEEIKVLRGRLIVKVSGQWRILTKVDKTLDMSTLPPSGKL